MNKKQVFIIVCFILTSIILLPVGYHFFTRYKEQNMRGQYTFSLTRQNIRKLAKVEIKSPQYGVVTLKKDEGIWHFVQAADYFANSDAVADLYKMINKSIISSVVPADFQKQKLLTNYETKDDKDQGIEFITYDSDGKLLDSVVINRQEKSDQYILRYKNKHYTYLVTAVFDMFNNPQAWIPYPLLSVLPEHISSIKIDGKEISADYLRQEVSRNLFLQNFLINLQFIEYDGIIRKTDFAEEAKQIVPRKLQILTPVGLIYELEIYKDSALYWLTVKLSSVKIPQKEVPEFVKNNQKYFEQWLFLLNENQGDIFYNALQYLSQGAD